MQSYQEPSNATCPPPTKILSRSETLSERFHDFMAADEELSNARTHTDNTKYAALQAGQRLAAAEEWWNKSVNALGETMGSASPSIQQPESRVDLDAAQKSYAPTASGGLGKSRW